MGMEPGCKKERQQFHVALTAGAADFPPPSEKRLKYSSRGLAWHGTRLAEVQCPRIGGLNIERTQHAAR